MRILLLLSLLIIENGAEGIDEGRTAHHHGVYTIYIVSSQIVFKNNISINIIIYQLMYCKL